MSHDRGARWTDTKYVLVDGKLRQKVTRNIERKKTIVTSYKVKARFATHAQTPGSGMHGTRANSLLTIKTHFLQSTYKMKIRLAFQRRSLRQPTHLYSEGSSVLKCVRVMVRVAIRQQSSSRSFSEVLIHLKIQIPPQKRGPHAPGFVELAQKL